MTQQEIVASLPQHLRPFVTSSCGHLSQVLEQTRPELAEIIALALEHSN